MGSLLPPEKTPPPRVGVGRHDGPVATDGPSPWSRRRSRKVGFAVRGVVTTWVPPGWGTERQPGQRKIWALGPV